MYIYIMYIYIYIYIDIDIDIDIDILYIYLTGEKTLTNCLSGSQTHPTFCSPSGLA